MTDRDGIIEIVEDEVLSRPAMTVALRWIGRIVAGLLLAALVTVLALMLLDTRRGHEWLADRVEALRPDSGLRINIGRIDGSLFDKLVVHDLVLSDPKGRFLEAPKVSVNWEPRAALRYRLHINSLDAPQVRLLKAPKLIPSEEEKPILPDFDIYVGRFTLGELVIEKPVLGKRQTLNASGSADIASGRLIASLRAISPTGGDALIARIDARPDDDRFALIGNLSAPTGGVIAGMLKLERPLIARVDGDGSWTSWKGKFVGQYGDTALANLALTGSDGHFTVKGTAAPGLIVGGLVRRLGSRDVTVDAAATIAERRIDADVALRSPSVDIKANGVVDLAENQYEDVEVAALLLDPKALIGNLTGKDMRLKLRLDGTIGAARVDYRFDADWLALSTTRLDRVVAVGKGAIPRQELRFPIDLTVARVTGVGEFVENLATNAELKGELTIDGADVIGRKMALRTDRLTAVADLIVDTRTGRYDVDAKGNVPRYAIPGFGLVDVDAVLNFVPEPTNPRQLRIRGNVDARVTRLDNSFLNWLFSGRPSLSASIDRTPDGTVTFVNAVLSSPDMRVAGRGRYMLGERIDFTGRAQSVRFGGMDVRLAGLLSRPEAIVRLDSYQAGVTLANLDARFTPVPDGYLFSADAQSIAGPVTANGRILTAADTIFDVEAIHFAGLSADGQLRLVEGAAAMSGTLDVDGQGIDGTIRLSPENGVQRFDAALTARSGRLTVPAVTSIRRGTLGGTLILAPGGADITGRFDLEGVTQGRLFLKKAQGTLEMRNGEGSAILVASGERGAPFSLDLAAGFEPERITITTRGSVARQPFALAAPAVFTRERNGWRLAPVALNLPEGTARVSGSFGDETAIAADLSGAGLELFELALPGIGLTGDASGRVDMIFAAGRLPRGEAKLRVTDFTRAAGGIAAPVDAAIVARLDPDRAVMRAVFLKSGQRLGIMQARLMSIPGSVDDPWTERLSNAPLSGQLRWRGPAEYLWPLTGVSALTMRGPIGVSIDVTGTLGDPRLGGLVRARGGHVESAITGTSIDAINLDGRFTGSALELSSFSGSAGKGTITGSGRIDLSFARGFPVDVNMRLDNADLLNRDDLRATASGPLRIRNSPDGAFISGDLNIDKARFRIGRPAQAEVPALKIREKNADLVRIQSQAAAELPPTIWQFDVKARGRNQIDVRGMGLDSEWSADLDIKGSANAPRLSGRATLIRGDYEFAGRRFELTRGDLRFTGGYPPDPVLDIAAEARVDGLTATISIRGTGQRPEIAFSSIPALPQDEVLSRVLFGSSITDLSAPEALQLAGAIASLNGGGGLNPIDSVRRVVGLDRLRVLQANAATGQKAAIAAGEYITNRVYVEVATDAQGYTATQLEVELTRALSILSQVATLGGTSINLKWSKDY